jgi:AcrR family transcriptional regulator
MEYIPEEFIEAHNTKGVIFRTAARLFAEKGYNGVSMREISELTGLSKPTIYYYFGNKEGIYRALVSVGLNYNSEQFQKLQEKNIPVKQKIIELVKMRFQQVSDYPDLAKFFVMLLLGFEKLSFLEDLISDAMNRRKWLVDMIQEAIKSGEFGTSARPELASEIFLGAISHFILKQLTTNEEVLTDQLAEDIVEMLFLGWNE